MSRAPNKELVYSDNNGNLDIKRDKYGCRRVLSQAEFIATYKKYDVSMCAFTYDLTIKTTRRVLIELGAYHTRERRELGDEWKQASGGGYWWKQVMTAKAIRLGLVPHNPRTDGTCRVLLHVYMMFDWLGRKREPYEKVHHKDENKDNNQVENFSIETDSSHLKKHRDRSIKGDYEHLIRVHGWIPDPVTGGAHPPDRAPAHCLRNLSDIPFTPV